MSYQHQAITSIDDLAHVINGTDMRSRLLGNESITGSLTHIDFNGIAFSTGQFSGFIELQGAMSPGMLTFGMLLGASQPGRQWLQEIAVHDVAIFPVGSEHHAIHRCDTTYATLAFTEDEFLEFADQEQVYVSRELLSGTRMMGVDHAAGAVTEELATLALNKPDAIRDPGTALEYRERLFSAYLSAITRSTSKDPEPRKILFGKGTIVQDAMSVIREQPEQHITVEALSKETGIPRRTLHRAFLETVGLSPAKYIRQVRLSEARRELCQIDPDTSITVAMIANNWGFSHLGRFAAEYKQLFGEYPVETLHGTQPNRGPIAISTCASTDA